MTGSYPSLADLALIGDRRTAAVIGRDATIHWYSPHRFDGPSIFLGLLDPCRGAWRVELPDCVPGGRTYVPGAAVLETRLVAGGGELRVTDWMTMGPGARAGLLCRSFSRAPQEATIVLDAWRDYGGRRELPALVDGAAVFEDGLHLFASHELRVDQRGAHWSLPRGEQGWTALANAPCARPRTDDLMIWKAASVERWAELSGTTTYDGPYRREVEASLRCLRLLVFEPTGAVAAAATAGLPEIIGGQRNYDYRYSWLRDTAMVVRAMLRTARHADEGDRFLDHVAAARAFARHNPIDAVVTVDGRPVPEEANPPLAGYAASRPVRIGNRAGKQLQLGALGNLLLAAGMVFRERDSRRHWDTVEAVADFLASHWQKPDSGIWEAPQPRQYTSSKAFAACGLEAVAPFAPPGGEQRYRAAAAAIRRYILDHCLTADGAFAAFEGARGVDVSAALFPVWSFCPADSPQMEATMRRLERNYEQDGLFRREDETPQSASEGAFLPATFWVAHYWAVRGDRRRARALIEAGLAHANDVGLMPEEIDWRTGRALGNLPLAMSHASFLSAAADLEQ